MGTWASLALWKYHALGIMFHKQIFGQLRCTTLQINLCPYFSQVMPSLATPCDCTFIVRNRVHGDHIALQLKLKNYSNATPMQLHFINMAI